MMEQDLIDLLSIWRGGEAEPARLEELLSRLRNDAAFLQSFVEEIRLLGMLKAVQSMEPRWLALQDELGWGAESRCFETETIEDEEAFWLKMTCLLYTSPSPRD